MAHKIDYQDLNAELTSMTLAKRTSLFSINKLVAFFKTIHTTLTKTVQSLTLQVKNNLQQEKIGSPIGNSIFSLINSFTQTTIKAKKILSQLNKDIIEPLDSLHQNQESAYEKTLSNFRKIIENVIIAKENLQNSYLAYHNAALNYKINKNNNNNNTTRLGKKVTEGIYYYELKNCNEILKENNIKYLKVITSLKIIEETKTDSIKNIQMEFSKIMIQFHELMANFMKINDELSSDKISDDERQCFKDRLHKYIQNKDKTTHDRLHMEKLISFADTCKLDTLENKEYVHDFEQVSKEEEEDFNEIIQKVQCKLYSPEDMSPNLISKLLTNLRSKPTEVGKALIESFAIEQKWFIFKNYNNLNALLIFILYISNHFNDDNFLKYRHDGCSSRKKLVKLIEVNNINKAIITLAQKVHFEYNNLVQDKVYLSALLARNNDIYKQKDFWKDLYMITLVESIMKHLSDAQEENENDDTQTKKEKQSLKANLNAINNNNFLSKIGINIKTTERKGIIFNSKLEKYIPNVNTLFKSDLKNLEDVISSEAMKEDILKKYITDLSSFNYPIEMILNLLTNIGDELNLSDYFFSYYMSYANICCYTIKRSIPNENKYEEDSYQTIIKKSQQEKMFKLITYGLGYLNWKDYFNVLQINRLGYSKISRKIYKIALNESSLKMETRLKIWEALLKIKKLKEKYSYTSLLKKISLNLDIKTRQEIQVDIPRTYINPSLNKTEARESIENILIAIAQVNETAKYCQGMNYIAQFLLEVTNDEEKAFYLFLGIFKSTDYYRIFSREITKFKVFFYIFERLLALYEPDISLVLSQNSIEVYYYLAPCFYTLFQNTRETIKEPGIPMVLVKIIDGTFLSGWKYLMKVALNLLHINTHKIRTMKIEVLYEFITTSVFTSDYFENSKLERFEMLQKIKITKHQIHYIEQEYFEDLKKNKPK